MNKFNSIFGQILKIFPRLQLDILAKETGASKRIKRFSCWDQFVSMMFCQLGQAHSLREICGGIATSMGKVVHLGIQRAPSRSTLSYANEHRPGSCMKNCFIIFMDCVSMNSVTNTHRFIIFRL